METSPTNRQRQTVLETDLRTFAGTGLNLTPSYLPFVPRIAINALLTDGSDGRFPAR